MVSTFPWLSSSAQSLFKVLQYFSKGYYHIISRAIIISRAFIIFTLCKFFTPALTDGFSQEPEWQQVSLGLLNSCNYPSWFWQYSGQDSLNLSFNFQVTLSLFQILGDYSNLLSLFGKFFTSVLTKRSKYLSIFLLSFIFTVIWWNGKIL